MNPKDDQERLRELESYSILDTLSDKDYDSLTALASEICQTPISLITLVDQERQWFKSHHGLAMQETPRIHSFCSHVVEDPKQSMFIQDATKDSRFRENPLVVGPPHIVFYAGVPLVSQTGHALGTLCVIDRKARSLTSSQKKALEVLADQVMRLLELRKSRFQLRNLNERLEEKNSMLRRFAELSAAKINSPLYIISHAFDDFSEKYGKKVGTEAMKLLAPVKEASLKLVEMVEALNSHAQIPELSRKKKDFINLNNVKKNIERIFPDTSDYQIRFLFRVEKIYSNQIVLEEILMQLLSNAIRHNDKPMADVEVGVRELKNVYEFFVSDNGPGITEEQLPHIFEMFRFYNPIGRYGEFSVGAGLSNAKYLVEELGGEIEVNSDVEEGTICTFSIPK